MWSKKERFEAVLNHELADRPPVSAWRHFTENAHSGAGAVGGEETGKSAVVGHNAVIPAGDKVAAGVQVDASAQQ